MTRELQWQTLIKQVLISAGEALSHHEIANRIAALGVLKDLGANPAMTVNATVSSSIKRSKLKSPFFRPERRLIALRDFPRIPADDADRVKGLISAYGARWRRSMVDWRPTNPKLLGTNAQWSNPVDFCKQKAIYVLYEDQNLIYVGSSARDHLGSRLRSHATGKLANKWDRFSWFGVYPVEPSGEVKTNSNLGGLDMGLLIRGLEAVLIEAIRPPRNARDGDTIRGTEFTQVSTSEVATTEKAHTAKAQPTKRSRTASKQSSSRKRI